MNKSKIMLAELFWFDSPPYHAPCRWLIVFCCLMPCFQVLADNTPGTAIEIDLGVEYSGDLVINSDVDYYRFVLPTAGNINLIMENGGIVASSVHSWRVHLFSEHDLASSLHSLKLKEIKFQESFQEGLPAGVYYLRVEDGHPSAAFITALYFLQVDFEPSDFYEKSPNNALNKATDIRLNESYTGNLAFNSDIDYFRFELSTPGNVTVSLENDDVLADSSQFLRVRLYHEHDLSTVLHAMELKETKLSQSFQEGLPDGVYYLQVSDGWPGATYVQGQYHLRVDFAVSAFYEQSPNNTPGTATKMRLNQGYTGNLGSNNDTDYYHFELLENDTVTVTLTHNGLLPDSVHSWRAELFSGDDFSAPLSALRLNEKVLSASLQEILATGIYFLRVFDGHPSAIYAMGQYNISVNLENAGSDTDNDGVRDSHDNCILVRNSSQQDTDQDKIGNACDPDFNQNGIVDQFDFSQLKACFGSTTCKAEDLNGNGIVDQFDFSRLKGMFGQAPGPSALAE